ncbi:TPA: bitter taste receptor Bota-T2R65A-like [Bos taurus]|nr:TPA: bitter taste receptor Bota-T2R65A-like [Bos taurus]
MKVKSESEVAQSGPTVSDPMDCSPRGSSVHGIFQARVLEWGAIACSESFYASCLLPPRIFPHGNFNPGSPSAQGRTAALQRLPVHVPGTRKLTFGFLPAAEVRTRPPQSHAAAVAASPRVGARNILLWQKRLCFHIQIFSPGRTESWQESLTITGRKSKRCGRKKTQYVRLKNGKIRSYRSKIA